MLPFFANIHVFYFATVDGDKPRVRPFGLKFEYEGKLYFGMGKHKQSWKQILVNPNVEICAATPDGEWIRIKGVANVDDCPAVLEQVFAASPMLRDIYNEQTGLQLGLIYLTKMDAEIASMKGRFEKVDILVGNG